MNNLINIIIKIDDAFHLLNQKKIKKNLIIANLIFMGKNPRPGAIATKKNQKIKKNL